MKIQRLLTILLTLTGLLSSFSVFADNDVQWLGKQTVVINRIFEITKPSSHWDTKIVPASSTPVWFALHKSGYNPQILVRLDNSPQGQTLSDYANNVKNDLSIRGVKVEDTMAKTIHNSEAILMNGKEPGGHAKWLVAVFRSQGVGYIVECMIWPGEYTRYAQDFMKSIESVRVNR